jgi:hypothetical protein
MQSVSVGYVSRDRIWGWEPTRRSPAKSRSQYLDRRREDVAGAACATRGRMVPVVRDVGRPAKANVSMDAGMLEAIDEEAAAHGLSASA